MTKYLVAFVVAIAALAAIVANHQEDAFQGHVEPMANFGGCPTLADTVYLFDGSDALVETLEYDGGLTYYDSADGQTQWSASGGTTFLSLPGEMGPGPGETKAIDSCTGTIITFVGDLAGYYITDTPPAVPQPEISDASINSAGDTLTIVWTENVDGTGGTPTITASGGAITAGTGSGTDGTNTRTHALTGRVIHAGETVTLDMAGSAVTATDDAAVSLAADDFPVTNDSVQAPPFSAAWVGDSIIIGGGIIR